VGGWSGGGGGPSSNAGSSTTGDKPDSADVVVLWCRADVSFSAAALLRLLVDRRRIRASKTRLTDNCDRFTFLPLSLDAAAAEDSHLQVIYHAYLFVRSHE